MGRTEATSAAACQARCRRVLGCSSFTYWPDGGCHVQMGGAARIDAGDFRVISGPPWCHKTSDGTTTLAANRPASVVAESRAGRQKAMPSGPVIWNMDEEAASPHGTRAKNLAGVPASTGSTMPLQEPYQTSHWWNQPWPLLLAVLCTTGIVVMLFLRRPMRETARKSLFSRDDHATYESRIPHSSDSEGEGVKATGPSEPASPSEHGRHGLGPPPCGQWRMDNQRKAPDKFWSPSFCRQGTQNHRGF